MTLMSIISAAMNLTKFQEAAWGTLKPQENKPWSNLQIEECTICLEPMGTDRTKIDCNHEFHIKVSHQFPMSFHIATSTLQIIVFKFPWIE